ncbi:Uncharacterized membrane protein [Franzmannia pantelleriensis]|uniref:Uncharacterized membrane protein n=1 Tax=Franzmannia pantelleriensis TaxID=48727 RepID=A0A1G9G987_9GAMM|nr:hypothetical protein [Halomonas pantelleriensis]SDK97101.1 Uncharacterized membrane protein [Halomonas pantelleriensis]
MNDTVTPEPNPVEPSNGPDTTIPIVVYVLLLAGIATGGLTSLIGVVIAYVYRGKGPDWLDEHYRFQIRTFWISLVYFLLAGILTLIAIGFVLWLAVVVWLVIRCVKGIKALQAQRAPDNVDTWLV